VPVHLSEWCTVHIPVSTEVTCLGVRLVGHGQLTVTAMYRCHSSCTSFVIIMMTNDVHDVPPMFGSPLFLLSAADQNGEAVFENRFYRVDC